MRPKAGAAMGTDAAAKVKQFVAGAYRLTISSESLAELLGLVETECRIALDALAASGLLRKLPRDSRSHLYSKD